MRTNIEIDVGLMADVQRECGIKTRKEAIDLGLRSLLRIGRQNSLRQLSGARGTERDIVWSAASEALFERLATPLDEREAVKYNHRFLNEYQPNVSFMLPPELAHELLQASTAAVGRRDTDEDVGDLFMMDFIWGGTRLRGSSLSRYGARKVLSSKELRHDLDTLDVLNHFIVHNNLIWWNDGLDLTCDRILTINSQHIEGHFDPSSKSDFRKHATNIPGSQYFPLSDAFMLAEMMDILIQKACAISNPIEAAFFLWLHLAYLHPFDTANHRTSRAAMNIPLLKAGLVPITFVNVDKIDYQKAKVGFYEFRDTSIAADLFTWAYMQSARRYPGFCLEGIWNPELKRR
ncbi:type II toxin-antitoxin system VapB family antitoxin [Herbaspirillum sp. LeCh32-8]|uniref:Fic family protein n=1 Tax=Herbaspirillum sp. LeCh32-8 TaxID=2821356 RepID=UPI001AE940AC|nr:Fic family protein [Herbaspirillum sp. LeCh32-8]MBP0597739.1 type II toxin-antitoxin system VapB family antitoxin [Herbaspirillum sp. LeCh32-8]